MSTDRKIHWRDMQPLSSAGYASGTLTLMARLVRDCGERIPSHTSLMERYGMSRATAYRWRKALIDSLPLRIAERLSA